MDNLISRHDVIECVYKALRTPPLKGVFTDTMSLAIGMVNDLPPARSEREKGWIPCSERLPENTEPVNITWVNRKPVPYYADIKDKPFTATGIYCNGKWYWYSSTTEDMLAEYGRYDSEEFDEAIECIAWMPLPEPYQSNVEEKTDG